MTFQKEHTSCASLPRPFSIDCPIQDLLLPTPTLSIMSSSIQMRARTHTLSRSETDETLIRPRQTQQRAAPTSGRESSRSSPTASQDQVRVRAIRPRTARAAFVQERPHASSLSNLSRAPDSGRVPVNAASDAFGAAVTATRAAPWGTSDVDRLSMSEYPALSELVLDDMSRARRASLFTATDECSVCGEHHRPEDVTKCPCGHNYCRECFRKLFVVFFVFVLFF